MGVERMHPPQYWRKRAEEFRTKADNCEHPQVEETLRQAANNYDELARRAEEIHSVEDLKAKAGGAKK